MLLSFPHMGKLHLALEKTCRLINIPCLVPSKPGPEALQLGQELAPEGSCMPFCLVLGNMREALEKGADTILMLGGSGPCRFGYFVYLAVKLLNNAGYRFDSLIIDKGNNLNNYRLVKKEHHISPVSLSKAARFGWELIVCEEMLDRLDREYRPLALDTAGFDQFIEVCRKRIREAECCRDIFHIKEVAGEYVRRMADSNRKEVLSIGLIGDIYTLLEPYANHRIEEYMRKNGVIVYKEMSVSGWLPNILLPWRKGNYFRELLQQSYPYLQSSVGGFGLESVANAQKMSFNRADGIIQLFPLGCMPEIVARSALSTICQKENVPVLSVTIDQHHGATGFEIRLEAFLDMLRSQKSREQQSVSGSRKITHS